MSAWGKSDAQERPRGRVAGFGRSAAETSLAPCLARILVLSEDKSRSRELSKLLRRHGYATFAGDFSVASRKLARDEHPDLALIDGGAHGETACKIASALKDAAHFPAVLITDEATAAFRRQCLAAGFDDLVLSPLDETILLSRLRPLVRLGVMNTELQQRVLTARSLGIDASADVSEREAGARRVLISGIGSRDFAAVEKALAKDFELSSAPDVFAAAAMLHQNPYDALVVVIDGNAEDALYLCSQIRNNTRLFNLPVLLFTAGNAFKNPADPYRSGASAVLLKPLDETALQTTIETLVRRQKLRSATRDRFAEIRARAGAGEVGGIFGRSFLLAHLDRLAAAAGAWRKHLSLVTFHIQNLGWVARDYGKDAADDLLRQAAEWISVLVRAEDMVARHDEKELCVLLPDTALEDAEVVAQRISGVLLNTQFGLKCSEAVPLGIWVQTGAADYRAGDTAASLLARAHQKLH